jgi:ribonuclease D
MYITKQKELVDFIKKAEKQPFVTVDTEFLREKTYYPKLCLVQIGLPSGEAVAIDPLADGIDLTPVFEILANHSIVKVFHAGRQDMEIFYRLMDEVPAPLFDTQIAAMVCGYGDQIGYDNLVRQMTGALIDKTTQFTDWSRRPLTKKQITYALGDVIHLVDVYEKLVVMLAERGRMEWVEQEDEILADPATYQNHPEESWKRVKVKTNKPQVLAVLRALAGWREERAQAKDIPRNWVMRDETLADMAAQMPKTAEQLGKIRNMPKDFPQSSGGETVVRLIKDALASNPDTWPEKERKLILPAKASACVDILKMLLKIKASEYEVAPRLIASNEDLDAIAMDDDADTPALKGWRREVFGKDALAVKQGRIAIGFRKGEIVRFAIDDSVNLHKGKK